MQDLAGTVILLGFLQGVVLVGVLAVRRTDRLANRLLAALIGAVAAMLLLGYLSEQWGFGGHPHWIALGGPLPFLFGPLLYLYIAALTRPIARFDPRLLVHGLPCAAYILYMLQVFYLKTADEKLALANQYRAGGGLTALHLLQALQVTQALTYVLASAVALRRYGRKIEGYYSDLTRINLRWLMVMVLTHAVVWSIVFATKVVQIFGAGGPLLRGLEQSIQIASSLAVFLMGYVSLWQPELFEKALAAQAAEADDLPDDVAPPKTEPLPERVSEPERPSVRLAEAPQPGAEASRDSPKYQRNRLDDREAEELAHQLRSLMEREEAYRDAGLTLPGLADKLGTTPHLLSQVLNVRMGNSFYVFVNSYRAEALKTALADPKRYERGVLELALEVGFNSKSTLNSFFKKHTGLTPTEFRRRAQARVAQNDAA